MHAAEQFAIIDNLSKGRLYTTMSRGYHPGYWDQFGIPHEKMLGRFLESIKIWKEAFKGERFDFDGKHWQVKQGLLTPGPYQEGGWPIWGGGNASPEAIRRSAKYGEAMTADPFPKLPEVWNEWVGDYKAAAEELGKKPFIVMMRDGWVDGHVRAGGRHVRHALRRGVALLPPAGHLHGPPGAGGGAAITPENCAKYLVMGTPQQCIEQLEMFHEELGVDYFTMRFRFPTGPSMEAAHEQIQRFGEEVVQPIHKKYPALDHPAIPAACRW